MANIDRQMSIVESHIGDIAALEGLLKEFNIFNLLSVSHLELAHTRILEFLFDPHAQHQFGDAFAQAFLSMIARDHPAKMARFEVSDGDEFEFHGSEIQREQRRIDLLVVDEIHKIAILIENKIHSKEHSEQLQRYHALINAQFPVESWRLIHVYLTLSGEQPSDDAYVSGSYREIARIIENLLNASELPSGSAVRLVLEHYVTMVKRSLVGDWDTAAEAKRLYDLAPEAFEFIELHKAYPRPALQRTVEGLIARSSDFISDQGDQSSKQRIMVRFGHQRFEHLQNPRISEPLSWTKSGKILLFQIDITPNLVILRFEVGPGPEPRRQRLLDIAKHAGSPFDLSFRETSQKTKGENKCWRSIYRRNLLDEKDFFDLDLNRLEELLTERWEEFVARELESIVGPFESKYR